MTPRTDWQLAFARVATALALVSVGAHSYRHRCDGTPGYKAVVIEGPVAETVAYRGIAG